MDFPGGLDSKASAYNEGDPGSIPGPGRSPGEGNGTPLQYPCWKIPWTEDPGGLQSTGSRWTLLHIVFYLFLQTTSQKIVLLSQKEN